MHLIQHQNIYILMLLSGNSATPPPPITQLHTPHIPFCKVLKKSWSFSLSLSVCVCVVFRFRRGTLSNSIWWRERMSLSSKLFLTFICCSTWPPANTFPPRPIFLPCAMPSSKNKKQKQKQKNKNKNQIVNLLIFCFLLWLQESWRWAHGRIQTHHWIIRRAHLKKKRREKHNIVVSIYVCVCVCVCMAIKMESNRQIKEIKDININICPNDTPRELIPQVTWIRRTDYSRQAFFPFPHFNNKIAFVVVVESSFGSVHITFSVLVLVLVFVFVVVRSVCGQLGGEDRWYFFGCRAWAVAIWSTDSRRAPWS